MLPKVFRKKSIEEELVSNVNTLDVRLLKRCQSRKIGTFFNVEVENGLPP